MECETCGKEFGSEEALRQHASAKHAGKPSMPRPKKKWGKYALIAIALLLAATIGTMVLRSPNGNALIPTGGFSHAHGLAFDKASNGLYIATHHGLLVLKDEKNLFRVGKRQDDYMGFTIHPTDRGFFSSGHPQAGGNLGLQVSVDGGFTWEKISNGHNGPVDFHAMAISPANPDLIYGWYRGQLQRSEDGGNRWAAFDTPFPIVSLAAHPGDKNILYAASPQGLFVSSDKGTTWDLPSEEIGSFVSVVAPHPTKQNVLFAFSEQMRLAKSEDGGQAWRSLPETFGGATVLYLAFDTSTDTIYALTHTNAIYKSTDEGETWRKIM
jgi:photosystem II stability/assembly factor-like uncharacterized protein